MFLGFAKSILTGRNAAPPAALVTSCPSDFDSAMSKLARCCPRRFFFFEEYCSQQASKHIVSVFAGRRMYEFLICVGSTIALRHFFGWTSPKIVGSMKRSPIGAPPQISVAPSPTPE